MKRHELLVPVGDMECLRQAIMNGCDAVYGGCKDFGARKFAKNFSRDEIVEAIRLCHLYGVKFYVTMNTLVKDSMVSSFLEQIEFLYQHGVDAVIMQDFGMISYVLEKYPNLEVHASTQFNNSSVDDVRLLYEMGVKRVVLSRELSLEEIESISVPIEKEVFIHGALCISYSGCCLMSSMIGGRSGNCGECAGSCRLPYRLFYKDKMISDSKYLLSTKELNTSNQFQQLLNSSIYSFKIEGRMKSPEYVGFITRMYRELIDSNGNTENLAVKTEQLKTIFNRDFTQGHLFSSRIDDFMNVKSPNHVGLPIGKVISVDSRRIKIRLDKDLHQGDGIRFLKSGKGFIVNYLYNKSGLLVSSVSAGDVCYIDNKVDLKKEDVVSKTSDFLLMQELKKLPKRLIPITFSVSAHVGEVFTVQISDGVFQLQATGSVLAEAVSAPVSKEKICKQLKKLGDTPFVCENIIVNMDSNIFLPLREINELRRFLVEQLMNARMKPSYQPIVKDVVFDKLNLPSLPGKSAYVYNEEQLLMCQKLGFDCIYTPNLDLFRKMEKCDTVYYAVPHCVFHIDQNIKSRNLIRDYFKFSDYDRLVGDYTLNVYNIYTAYYLYRLGLKKITLSVELSVSEIHDFIHRFQAVFGIKPNVEVISYGLVCDMIIKGNILGLKEDDFSYYLEDLRGRRFPVFYHGNKSYILNYQSFLPDEFSSLKDVVSFRYQFFLESKDDIQDIVKKYE